MTIGEIISTNRKKMKMSQPQLAEELNKRNYSFTNKAISKWEKGATEPGISVLMELCRILEIPDLYEAFYGENPWNPISKLNEEGREKVYEYADLLIQSGRFSKVSFSADEENRCIPFVRRLPLQLYPVSAGPGNFLDDQNYEDIPVDDDVPMSADFGVRVSGDSMEPMMHRNQIIWVHKQATLENGEIGIFFLDGEAYVKKLQNDEKGTYLISLNEKYAPISVTEQSDFRIFGRVVG
ncbi:MAG: XRE family transcriptional regulator [Dorea sp.]|nr:XRE family transcriptional regulator [Dorea sp.]